MERDTLKIRIGSDIEITVTGLKSIALLILVIAATWILPQLVN